MHLDTLRDHCLAKPGATEDLPFGPDVLVFKVAGKMFAMTNLERMPLAVGMRCRWRSA
ncbi:MAG: MmcQ/YjbR family DNA-binding protein [Bacteroidota bacterium]